MSSVRISRKKQIKELSQEIRNSVVKPVTTELAPELKQCAKPSFMKGMIEIKHPFYNSSTHTDTSNHYANCQLKLKRLQVEQATDEKNWQLAICLYERPSRLLAFHQYMENFDDVQYWNLLAYIYADTESFWQDRKLYSAIEN